MKKFLAFRLSDVFVDVKMQTIVCILTFKNRINFVLSWVEHGKRFITSGPDHLRLHCFHVSKEFWKMFCTQSHIRLNMVFIYVAACLICSHLLEKTFWWLFNALHPGKIFMFFLSSADFLQTQLFRKILSGIPSECFFFCRLLISCKLNFFEKFFQEYHQSVKQIWSGPTFWGAWSQSKLFVKY